MIDSISKKERELYALRAKVVTQSQVQHFEECKLSRGVPWDFCSPCNVSDVLVYQTLQITGKTKAALESNAPRPNHHRLGN
jgi:hypothetical protein